MQCRTCGRSFSREAAFCPFDGVRLAMGAVDPLGDTLLGTVVDRRYEVLDVLGEGGMGRVYRVRHTSLGRTFAMKVLRRDLALDGDLAERFIHEAKTTAAVKHPNVVQITDFGQLGDGAPYFVMELLVGQTLGQIVKAGGPIPAGRAVRIIRQIAGALAAAHAAGVVHRDLKPDNVFLVGDTRDGPSSDAPGRGRSLAMLGRDADVRVVDFGAAKIVGSSRITRTGVVFGTPHYMSPEQASGQPVDHRADVYALGVIMYEMFTGRVPFEADTYMGVLTQHMFVQPVPPSQVSEAARELGALEEITLVCLEKKPEDRFGSMNDLVEAVDRVVRLRADGSVEVASRADSPTRPGPRSAPLRIADELEPPTFEELRAATGGALPPKHRALWAWIPVAAAGLVAGVAGAALLRSSRPPATGATAPATTATSAATFSASLSPPPVAPPPAPVVPLSAVSATEDGTPARPRPPPRRPPPRHLAEAGVPPADDIGDPFAAKR
jgi:serine/threonine protein kinase